MKAGQKTAIKTVARKNRHKRVRAKICGTTERPRLAVFRSNTTLSAQIIDDSTGKTLIAVSTKGISGDAGERAGKTAQAYVAGKELAEKAKQKNISTIVFDRGGFAYQGRVKALAEGARDGGLLF